LDAFSDVGGYFGIGTNPVIGYRRGGIVEEGWFYGADPGTGSYRPIVPMRPDPIGGIELVVGPPLSVKVLLNNEGMNGWG
jgi:hypothetical protein